MSNKIVIKVLLPDCVLKNGCSKPVQVLILAAFKTLNSELPGISTSLEQLKLLF
jgi:hypothetical protein